ncbi:MAG: antitoxin [Verrucomicrobia bacterium]|nr:antitoxin [Verrucomicrobiota bacterium]
MRTTVTLDPDVAEYVREACHKRKKSFKAVLNEALRESLKPAGGRKRKLLKPQALGLAAGVDARRLAELADDLEAEGMLAAEGRRKYGKARK